MAVRGGLGVSEHMAMSTQQHGVRPDSQASAEDKRCGIPAPHRRAGLSPQTGSGSGGWGGRGQCLTEGSVWEHGKFRRCWWR